MKPIGIIVCCVLTIVASASFYGYRKSSDTVSNLKGKIEAQAVSNKAQLDFDAEQIESAPAPADWAAAPNAAA